MQDLLSGRISLSEVFVNKILAEFTDGTEYEKEVSIVLVGEDRVTIKVKKPLFNISEVSLKLEKVIHDRTATTVQFRVGEVGSNNFLVKPAVVALKSKLLSWFVQRIGTAHLPKGIRIVVNGDQIFVEMRQWLHSTKVGSMEMPVIGKILETARISSARIAQGEMVVEMRFEALDGQRVKP